MIRWLNAVSTPLLALLLPLLSGNATAKSVATAPATIAAEVGNLLSRYYTNDSKVKTAVNCPDAHLFAYSYQGNPYCMALSSAKVKSIQNQQYLFVNFNGDVAQDAGHATTGLSGLFVLKATQSGDWAIVAKNPYIENGQWGNSQLQEFKLVQIGPQQYGWVGEFSGSGAGGESSSNWTLFAPIGNKIAPVITEEISHDYTGAHWVKTVGKVTILANHTAVGGYYPIQVTRITQTAPTNANQQPIKTKIKTRQENYTINFNGKRFFKAY